MKEDRIRDRETFIERQDKQNKKTAELKKWEMINRYKSDEVMKKFNENMRKEHWRKILEYRKDLLEQIVCSLRFVLVEHNYVLRQFVRIKKKKYILFSSS